MLAVFLLLFKVYQAIEISQIPANGIGPSNIAYHFAVYDTLTEEILFFGGLHEHDEYNDKLWSYDVINNIWSQKFPSSAVKPMARVNCGLMIDVAERKLYVFGGKSRRGMLNDMWMINLEDLVWTELQTLGDKPNPISNFSQIDGQDENGGRALYIFGGTYTGAGAGNDTYSYSASTNTWKHYAATGDIPSPRDAAAMAYYNHWLYIHGGGVINQSLDDRHIYRFDIATENWEILETNGIPAPESRMFHKIVIYVDMMYVFQGWRWDPERWIDEVAKFDMLTNTWISWEMDKSPAYYSVLPRDSYFLARYNEKIFIHGGLNILGSNNDMFLASLYGEKLYWEQLQKRIRNPQARMHHSTERVADKVYLFGGNFGSQIFGDLWEFDMERSTWEQVQSVEAPPAPRTNHASTIFGVNIYVWGGQGISEILDDLYSYNVLRKSWTHMEVFGSLRPPPLRGACMASDQKSVYIFGGLGDRGFQNILWKYDKGTHEYSLVNDGSFRAPPKMWQMKCHINISEGVGLNIMIIQGEASGQVAMGSIWRYDIQENTWTEVNQVTAKSQMSFNLIGDVAIGTGGQQWGTYCYNDITVWNLRTRTETTIGKLPEPMYGHSSFYYKKNLYLFGGGSSVDQIIVPDYSISSMYKVHIEELSCSLGSVLVGEECQPCAKGTFSEVVDDSECTLCPMGSENVSLGAYSRQNCNPCPKGKFANTEGSILCKDCPIGTECRVGAISPIMAGRTVTTDNTKLIQPDGLKSQTSEVDRLNTIYYICWGIIVIFAFVLINLSTRAKIFMKKLDLYTQLHNHLLEIDMTLRKTFIGGLCSVTFFISIVVIIASSATLYQLDNVLEQKALVPWTVIEENWTPIEADLHIEVMFEYYPGNCTNSSTEDPTDCHPEIFITDSGLQGKMEKTQCRKENDDCSIIIKCNQCTINRRAQIEYTLSEVDSYASSINFNVTSSSSIPDNISSVSSEIHAGDSQVFRGSEASEIPFIMTQSVFDSETDGEQNAKGYHVNLEKAIIKGSMQHNDQIYAVSGLRVQITLFVSEYALQTARINKMQFGQFFFTTLGSCVALLSVFGGLMRAIEGRWYWMRDNQQLKQEQASLAEQLDRLKSTLDTIPAEGKDPPIIAKLGKIDHEDSLDHSSLGDWSIGEEPEVNGEHSSGASDDMKGNYVLPH